MVAPLGGLRRRDNHQQSNGIARLPITPPTAAPAATPIAAPYSFLFRLAHALAPMEPTMTSAVNAYSRLVFDIFMYSPGSKRRERQFNSGATSLNPSIE